MGVPQVYEKNVCGLLVLSFFVVVLCVLQVYEETQAAYAKFEPKGTFKQKKCFVLFHLVLLF